MPVDTNLHMDPTQVPLDTNLHIDTTPDVSSGNEIIFLPQCVGGSKEKQDDMVVITW